MGYQPIENYGIIGDLNTVALVGLNGSIDFMCFPDFDSPSIFAALLDDEKGGKYQLYPVFGEMKTKQLYFPDTNVLLTRFLSADGGSEVTDFMPVVEMSKANRLIRRATSIKGQVKFKLALQPRFNYARSPHSLERISTHEIVFHIDDKQIHDMRFISSVPIIESNNDVFAEFVLNTGEHADFILEPASANGERHDNIKDYVTNSLFTTVNYWKDWIAQSEYKGRWLETVNRSALLLKLLTSSRNGSIVAAPTFSLPESIGHKRNFDYRYTWIRDASFTIYALLRLGYTREARDFMNWVERMCEDVKGHNRLGIMYSINGARTLKEITLPNLEGYMKSGPVRIGNDAYHQLQLDVYGELLDSVYLSNKHAEPISYDFWRDLAKQIDWLATNWDQADEGIWEVRGGKKKFLYSRLMCWVAIDRAIRIAGARSFPIKDTWAKQRDIIYNSIYEEFWDKDKKAFMQYRGAETVDASTLLMPLVRFISPKDPRWLSTLKRIEEELSSDILIYRYRPEIAAPDGFISHEGTFSMCSFWYVECLSRSGQLEKARFFFEKMLGYANHLGLYSEELGFEGQHLGNFPQAFTHLALISAAYNLNHQLNDRRNKNVIQDF